MEKTLYKTISIIYLTLFMPVLFCVLFIGNSMDYYEVVKRNTLLPNIVLSLLCVGFFAVVFLVYSAISKNIKPGTKKEKAIVIASLAVYFVVIYFANVFVSKCIAFYSGWDMSIMSGSVYDLIKGLKMENNAYYSSCPNNVPGLYILFRIYLTAMKNPDYIAKYNGEFLWIQTVCAEVSLACFCVCISVMRILKRVLPTILCAMLSTLLICASPWKVIPYTDMLTIVISIFALTVFIFYCSTDKWYRYILWGVVCFTSTVGGVIKATLWVVLIAVVVTELISIVSNKSFKKLIPVVALLVVSLVFAVAVKGHMERTVGYRANESLKLGWQHYWRMGLNEPTTGGYNGDYSELRYAFLDKTVSERHAEEMRLIKQEYKDKGVLGTIYFYLRKNCMNYNDGTFGWFLEGNFYFQDYQNLTDSSAKDVLRSIYWEDGRYYRLFLTITQMVWLFILMGLPGSCIEVISKKCDATTRKQIVSVVLSVLGISLFVMIFEGRARYFLNYSPVFLLAGVLGIDYYCICLKKFFSRKKPDFGTYEQN